MSATRVVALGSTFYFDFASRAYATGVPTILAGTPVLKAFELDAAQGSLLVGITWAARTEASLTMINTGAVVATTANGYDAGKTYSVYITTGTVSGVSAIGEKVYEFRIETVQEQAARLLQENLWPTTPVIPTTTTGNTTGRINVTDLVDAQTADADLVGSQWLVVDGVNLQAQHVIVTSVQSARLMNVELLADGSALDFTVAVGDYCIFLGFNTISRQSSIGGLATGAAVSAAQTDLDTLTDDWNNGGRLDLILDIIAADTTTDIPALFTFTKANELDVNVQSINGAGVVGDGNATPWDGA